MTININALDGLALPGGCEHCQAEQKTTRTGAGAASTASPSPTTTGARASTAATEPPAAPLPAVNDPFL